MVLEDYFCFAALMKFFLIFLALQAFHFNVNIPAIVFQNEVNQQKQARALGHQVNYKVWRVMKYFDRKHKLVYLLLFAIYHSTLVLLRFRGRPPR